jgi:integrase
MSTVKLTKRRVDAAPVGQKRTYLWDSEVKGFGLRVLPSGRKVFVLSYRAEDGAKRMPALGTYGTLTVEQARDLAKEWMARVRSGEDPSQDRRDKRLAPTVDDAVEKYLEEHSARYNKPSSHRKNQERARLHVLPALGRRKVASITREDILRLHGSMRDRPGAANRTVALLSKMLACCMEWGWHPGPNPAQGIKKYREQRLHRDLSEFELRRLAKAMREAESGDDPSLLLNPTAIAAIRLLMFSGCRRGEVLGLRWDEVDIDRGLLRLKDSKSGQKTVWLNSAAREVIKGQEPLLGNPHVFPGKSPGKPLHDLNGPWKRIRERTNLHGVRLHDLRHSFASWAAGEGQSLVVIGKLLGHKVPATTARYADLANDPARAAAEQVGSAIAKAMGEREMK